MEEKTISQNEGESTANRPEEAAAKPKWWKQKKIVLGGAALITIIAVVIIVIISRGSVFDRLVSEMLDEYPYADNSRATDGSYLRLDTNPYDKDIDDMTYVELSLIQNVQRDTLGGIQFINKKLGFTEALYNKMLETSALMGRQTEENDKYRVSWTYHPDKGLEVTYEKK